MIDDLNFKLLSPVMLFLALIVLIQTSNSPLRCLIFPSADEEIFPIASQAVAFKTILIIDNDINCFH